MVLTKGHAVSRVCVKNVRLVYQAHEGLANRYGERRGGGTPSPHTLIGSEISQHRVTIDGFPCPQISKRRTKREKIR